jgi:hypothetical protein
VVHQREGRFVLLQRVALELLQELVVGEQNLTTGQPWVVGKKRLELEDSRFGSLPVEV